MIPIRLEIKNFLPYRVPDPVKFEGVHLACLTGSNGAGKSSILDAVTWALWGKARARRDDDLIHQGQENMSIQLDFEQEGTIYRVYRRRSKGKRGTGALDLFVVKDNGERTTISEPSMTATQQKINDLLRLDYETFVHSAFLQQGKADAFTTQTPAQRKKILGDILGLERWAVYEDRTKAKLKEIETELNFCDGRINEINEELQRKPALIRQRDDAQKSYTEAQTALKQAQSLLDDIRHAPNDLRTAKANREERARRLREYERDLEMVNEQLERQQEQLNGYQQIADMEEDILSGYSALQEARELDGSLQDKLDLLRSIKDRRHEIELQLSEARTSLKNESKTLAKSIADLKKVIAADPSDELDTLQARLDELRAVEVQRDDVSSSEVALKEERAGLNTRLKSLEAEGQKLNGRIKQLEETSEPVCPVCGQDLDEEHREKTIIDLNTEVETMRGEYSNTRTRLSTIDGDLKVTASRLREFDTALRELSSMNEQVGMLSAQSAEAERARIRLEEEETRLDVVTKQLNDEDFAQDIRAALRVLDKEQHELGYDQDTHDGARQTLKKFHEYESLKTRLEIAKEAIPTAEAAVEVSQTRLNRLNTAIEEVNQELGEIDTQMVELQVQVDEYEKREEEVRRQQTLERTAHEGFIRAEQALNSLDAQQTRKAQLETRRDDLRYREAIYKELKNAFGKNGIPAMIIETAIPELEASANDLLGRMTDGRMSLRLTTQREKVTGGMTETLDIEIADELGTRAYEMYSGGEAFRINFAVRVALSQLLARRAGAHLRTLFIDEGFGTQDESGREKLIEAINVVQSEFDLILVITHIDELRDNFPVHVVVEKSSNGSRITMR